MSNQLNQQKEPSQSEKEVFDASTMENIEQALIQLEYDDEQRIEAGINWIKFKAHMERKTLKFTGKWKELHVQAKDFVTKQTIPDKIETKYRFECYDIANDPKSQELCVWERGLREYRQIMYWFGQKKNILQVIRNGQPGNKQTTYMISAV